jgi:tRNA-dihydrouridine synthase 2
MGCPVKFSLQGGMGSALLTEPEKVRDILTTLRRNLPASLAVTAKIRLLDDYKQTLQLAQLIESCGVAALAVHARRRHDRPRHWAQWDEFRRLRDMMPASLPLILNGDVFSAADVAHAALQDAPDRQDTR